MQYEFKNIYLEDPPLHSCWWSLTIAMGIESPQITQLSTFGVSPTCKKTFHLFSFGVHFMVTCWKETKKQLI